MSSETRPFFVVSSGRSGTAMMQRLFSAYPHVEMHHEYMMQHVQPAAIKYYLGLIGLGEAVHVLRATHGASIHHTTARLWGDSSHALSWLIPVLNRLFPNARFIHLVRDGRHVTQSYFNTRSKDCYTDDAVLALQRHYDSRGQVPAPPPEGRFWWPVPPRGHPLEEAFHSLGRFERIAFHWAQVNRTINHHLDAIPPERKHLIRLEDMASRPEARQGLMDFLGLPWDDRLMGLVAPASDAGAEDPAALTPAQAAQFDAMASDMMQLFCYDRPRAQRAAL
jgi:hypothetical protein